ncbi:hypothetical protein WN55_00341 [Dufourea novaeangliae]|uniref:Uncharacterized protein n=1 Tax=Dufourea novaeangliae TaxID=178035 RepID=A0A154PFG1_DUFNO|nr:hypothetical protein WN55_00341 [Dufourea novaeangliae]
MVLVSADDSSAERKNHEEASLQGKYPLRKSISPLFNCRIRLLKGFDRDFKPNRRQPFEGKEERENSGRQRNRHPDSISGNFAATYREFRVRPGGKVRKHGLLVRCTVALRRWGYVTIEEVHSTSSATRFRGHVYRAND